MIEEAVTLSLPQWFSEIRALEGRTCLPGHRDQMAWVLSLLERQVEERSGGPFSAAVFETQSGRLVAAGLNRVEAARCSLWHAETVALLRAHRRLGTWDLAQAPGAPFTLVASAEPCAMCLGATIWSGVSTLVLAARDEDARGIGFDEGPKPSNWPSELRMRRIEVVRDLMRGESVALLHRYLEAGGAIYNPRGVAPKGPSAP